MPGCALQAVGHATGNARRDTLGAHAAPQDRASLAARVRDALDDALPVGHAGGRAAPPATPLIFWSATAYQVSLRGISGTPNIAFDMDVELW